MKTTNQIIKSKRSQQTVALNIVNKVREALSWNNEIKIETKNNGDFINIDVSSSLYDILTGTTLKCIIDVVSIYSEKYPANVTYCIDTTPFYVKYTANVLHRPVFCIRVSRNDK